MDPKELLQIALEKAGGPTKLARAINVGNSTVTRWKNGRTISGAYIAILAKYVAHGTEPEKSDNQQMPHNGLKYLQDTLASFTNTNLPVLNHIEHLQTSTIFFSLVSCLASMATFLYVTWKLG